jgi:hypothetical protein
MEYALPKAESERRSTIILVQYWNQLRGDSELPQEDSIDPDRLIGVWERCFVVQLRDIKEVKDYNYTYYGPDLIEAFQDGRLEEPNRHIASTDAKMLQERYEEVIAEAAPVMQEGEYEDSAGRIVKYRQILMPFGKEDGTVEAIMGGVWFRHD